MPAGFSILTAIALPDKSARQRIVLLVGLPGAGKSTWIARRNLNSISSDQIRLLLSDDASNQTIHARVFSTVRYLLRQRLATGQQVTYIDATNLTRVERLPYIRIAEWYGCDIEAVFFNIPSEDCLRRNATRSRVVPFEAMQSMSAKLQVPEMSEGFTGITHVSIEPALTASRE